MDITHIVQCYAKPCFASDHIVSAYVHTYNFPALITNCSNNYGPYQFPDLRRRVWRSRVIWRGFSERSGGAERAEHLVCRHVQEPKPRIAM